MAVVDRTHGVMRQKIVSVAELNSVAKNWTREFGCSRIVVGNKTASKQILEKLESLLTEHGIESIVTVDEHKSTEQARRRYWQANPPRGWRQIVPSGLLVPPCAVDDFAAIILAERYFKFK
jgi:RNase H-fold protein (predicted Holliday junction resolvase)